LLDWSNYDSIAFLRTKDDSGKALILKYAGPNFAPDRDGLPVMPQEELTHDIVLGDTSVQAELARWIALP
jgi:hypothetical protein